MCNPTREKQRCVGLSQIGWVEGEGIGKEIADVVKSHYDHHQTPKHINGVKTRRPGQALTRKMLLDGSVDWFSHDHFISSFNEGLALRFQRVQIARPRGLALTTRPTLAPMARLSLLRRLKFSFTFFGELECGL